ncbi:MAG: restriction endonuclease subunit S [Planctomycetota bacterium]|jgi:type I restriction enzyme S subunit
MSWRTLTIGDLVDSAAAGIQTGPFGTQLKASDYVDEGTPVVNVRNIGFGGLRPEKLEFVTGETAERLAAHLLEPRDIVFGRKGAVNRHLYVSDEQEHWMQGSDCIRLRFLTKDVVSRFVSYSFLTETHQKWMLAQAGNKATMASLNHNIIKRIEVRLPAPTVQQAAVDILSAYDDPIENNRRRMVLLEEAARQLYREWFVRLRFPGHEHTRIVNGVPEGWQKKTLGDLCEDVRESVKPGSLEADTPYIGLEHMPRRSISLSEWGTAEQVTSTKHRFREGEILFGKIRPYFHKVGVAFVDGIASSDAIVIRPLKATLYGFVLMTASSDPFVAVTAQTMKEGSKMPRADWKQMQQYMVPLPPDGLLSNFDSAIQSIVEQLKTLTFANQKLRAARDLLLPRLMSGEIAV